jgi:hypothetical protein
MTRVGASARTNFYPCRVCSSGTQCSMRTKCAGKPQLPTRPFFEDGHCVVIGDLRVAPAGPLGSVTGCAGLELDHVFVLHSQSRIFQLNQWQWSVSFQG